MLKSFYNFRKNFEEVFEMKKFFVVAWLILSALIVQTTPAFAAYSDDQIMSTFRTRLARMAKTSPAEFS